MWEKVKGSWLWKHKVKVLGSVMACGGYVQHNLAQIGFFIPDNWQGVILSGCGVLVFVAALLHTFIDEEDEP